MNKVMRMVGGARLLNANPLEQMYRDVRAAIVHQPFQGDDALAWLGKLAFGIHTIPCRDGYERTDRACLIMTTIPTGRVRAMVQAQR